MFVYPVGLPEASLTDVWAARRALSGVCSWLFVGDFLLENDVYPSVRFGEAVLGGGHGFLTRGAERCVVGRKQAHQGEPMVKVSEGPG